MILARLSTGGVLIGLSARNIELLMERKPIYRAVDGLPEITIVYGATEQDIAAELEPMIHAGTRITNLD